MTILSWIQKSISYKTRLDSFSQITLKFQNRDSTGTLYFDQYIVILETGYTLQMRYHYNQWHIQKMYDK